MTRNKYLNEYLKLFIKVFFVLISLSFLYIIYLYIFDGSNHQSTMKRPVVINTWDVAEANKKAWSILENHGKALDAVEKGCAVCEELQCGLTVGYGGSPDENGETTLDAMIFDGMTMNVGAVGALRRVKNAISVARHVLDYTEHSLLVGEQATSFAVQMGFKEESLSTNTSEDIWKEWKAKNCQPNFWKNVTPDPKTSCGPYKPAELKSNVSKDIVFDSQNHDTIGMVALDSYGNIASATSTNGARHKIPGRVGDSPIPGAGAYAEKDVGGAAATGDGDVMMRFLPSFKAVEELKRSSTPEKAAENALRNIVRYYEKFSGAIVVMAANGEVGAACAGMKSFPYVVSYSDNVAITYHVNCINN